MRILAKFPERWEPQDMSDKNTLFTPCQVALHQTIPQYYTVYRRS